MADYSITSQPVQYFLEKSKLNSEIVKSEEPVLWNRSPSWQRAYGDTHRL